MIVQELRQIQERCGWLPRAELQALSERLNVPLRRLHEVASFYPLYRLSEPPNVEVLVCRDMACHINGAPRLIESLTAYGQELAPAKVHVGGVSCLGQCDKPVACLINDHHVYRGVKEAILRTLMRTAADKKELPHQKIDNSPANWEIDIYKGKPPYDAVRQYLAGGKNADALIKKLEVAGLRGMGGAGFPTFRKWSAVRGAPGDPKYVVCNADESEPGTFKDRELIRRAPHLLIEGMILAGLVVGAEQAWIYIRHEYPDELHALEKALADATKLGVIGDNVLGSGIKFRLEPFVSPGGYVQGEESALLEAMEDRRGEPRNKPPFPVFNGLYNKPTVINNVETLMWVPGIAIRGGEWYRDGGTHGATGRRFVSISGDVAKPGVYEVPFGQLLRELVNDTAGGPLPGRTFKAFAMSGPSGGFHPTKIPAALLPQAFKDKHLKPGATEYDIFDLPLDLNTVSLMGGMLGAAFIVYDNTRDLVQNALNCVEFYRNESCGKCVPCRTGSQKLADLIKQMIDHRFPPTQLPLIGELGEAMVMASICGLGQVASNPMTTVVKYFRPEVDKYLASYKK